MAFVSRWLQSSKGDSSTARASSASEAFDGPKVLAVGLSRTGTKSLQEGLIKLGFGPSYHMGELLLSPTGVQDAKEWLKAYNGEPADLKRVLKGYRSTLDAPSIDFFEEMMGLYPTAKVILQTREAGAWAKSVDESIGTCFNPPNTMALWAVLPNNAYQRQVALKWFERAEKDPKTHQMDPDYMRRWSEHVRARVPPEKLLVWSVKEGYAPLCKFLDVPMVKEPFPHANDTKELIMVAKALVIACHLVTAAWVASIGSIIYLLYTYSTAGMMNVWVRNIGAVSFFVAIFAQLQPALMTQILLGPIIVLLLFGVYILPVVAGITALAMNRTRFGF